MTAPKNDPAGAAAAGFFFFALLRAGFFGGSSKPWEGSPASDARSPSCSRPISENSASPTGAKSAGKPRASCRAASRPAVHKEHGLAVRVAVLKPRDCVDLGHREHAIRHQRRLRIQLRVFEIERFLALCAAARHRKRARRPHRNWSARNESRVRGRDQD